jgi:dTDP-L-rhamnose 4-epimerase
VGYAIFRLQNVYGEGQSLNNPYTGILSIFSTRIRRGLEVPLFEDGLESRDFVHVEDVADAIIRGVTSSKAVNEVLNVGSGVATSVCDVALGLSEALGRHTRTVVTGEYRIGDIRHNFADISVARDRLGFVPRIDLKEGLKKLSSWVMTKPLPEDRLDEANRELKERRLMG